MLQCIKTILLTALLIPFIVQAQTGIPESNPRDALDRTQMIESSISKVYRARVLLEDHNNWPEAYELLRDVISNEDNLDSVIKAKLRKAAGRVSSYLPGRWFRRTFNKRHLIRPFLEASYLINEALMDWRVALNNSTDSEVPFVESLLKSYFFPGSEAQGVIEFPNASTYSFDLFALTAENIAKARRERSTSGSNPDDNQDFGGSRLDRSTGVDFGDLDLNARFSASNGFIDKVLDSGVAIGEITKEVESLIKRLQIKKRVNNRYLELSMLMQAVTDPGSALFDPQLQSFLRGVRLRLALGSTDKLGGEDISQLRNLLGDKAVVESTNGTRILLSYLIDQQQNNPYQKTGMELQVNQVGGSGRSVLYVVSTVSGPDLMRLRTLNMAAVLARDVDRVGSLVASSSAAPWLAKGVQAGHISLQKVLAMLPKAANFVNQLAQASQTGAVAVSLKALAGTLKGAVALQNIGVKVAEVAGPRSAQLLRAVKNNKYVKNGTVAGVLIFATAAVQITVGVVEYRHAQDEDLKHEIYINTLARTGATLTYALPVVGWGAAALDLSHAFLGVPFETADLFRGFSRGVEAATYWFLGTSATEVEYTNLENTLGVPRHEVYFRRHIRFVGCETSIDNCQQAIARLRGEMQDLALSQLTLLYVAHRTFAAKTNNKFGRRTEDYMRDYMQKRRLVREYETLVQDQIKELTIQQLAESNESHDSDNSFEEEAG
jgi:hypothetical protein